MTRHGMVQSSTAGAQPSATNRRVLSSMVAGNRIKLAHPSCRQSREGHRRRGLTASTQSILDSGRTIADISRKQKSP